jgi:hypothetical protein
MIRGSWVRIKVKVLDKDEGIPSLASQGYKGRMNEVALQNLSYKMEK